MDWKYWSFIYCLGVWLTVCTSIAGRLALKEGETKYNELLLIAPLLNLLKKPFSVSRPLGRRTRRNICIEGNKSG